MALRCSPLPLKLASLRSDAVQLAMLKRDAAICKQWEKNPGWDDRTLVFCRVLEWVIYLIKHGGLVYCLLENVMGIANKMHGCSGSFLDFAMDILSKECPQFSWRVDKLNAAEYLLAQRRHRVIIQGARRLFLMVKYHVRSPL